MLSLRCRSQLWNTFSRRTLYTVPRNKFHPRLITRPVVNPTRLRLGPQLPSRLTSTATSSRLDNEGVEMPVQDEEVRQIITRAKQVWPCPPLVPKGWSCAWENWSYLLTFYWLSPYYLMLPQIEMVVNIRYRIPGETRPILFSNEKQAFIFTLVEDEKQFFMFDGIAQELLQFEGVHSVEELVTLMDRDDDMLLSKLRKIEPDAEGEAALQRILARDKSVIPLLAEKFLDYTPIPTKPWEEGTGPNGEYVSEEEKVEALEDLVKEAEQLMAERGVNSEAVEMAEDEDEDWDKDVDVEKEEGERDEIDVAIDNALNNLDMLEGLEELERLAREENEAK